MTHFNRAALTAALALALSSAAFANDPGAQETVAPLPDAPISAPPADVPASTAAAFADLDTDADGFVSAGDFPAEHELSLQFALADTDQDARLSQAEFEAWQDAPEEEEAEE
jgi:hypothetical protein